jgi:uncharacterized membrane protein
MLWHNNSAMFHDRTGTYLVPPEPHFRWRGGEITRLEGFTDAVFAFAVTLLVVSLEVPHTYAELIVAMKGFGAFAICFLMLVQVWYYHYIYSRRYGLQTTYTVVLNSILLFVVLFYVYPLKFLFTYVVGAFSGGLTVPRPQLFRMLSSGREAIMLMFIYSIGYTAVFALFALLYRYAYRLRSALELNEYEVLRTRQAMTIYIGFAAVGVLVIILAFILPEKYAVYSGMLYSLNSVIGFGTRRAFAKREKQALARMQAVTAAKAPR